jgi:hypothetical protein
LLRPYARDHEFKFVGANAVRWRAIRMTYWLAGLVRGSPFLGAATMIMIGFPLAIAFLLSNALSRISIGSSPKGHVSSTLIKITIAAEQAREAYRYSASRTMRARSTRGRGLGQENDLKTKTKLGSAPSADAILTGIKKAGARD